MSLGVRTPGGLIPSGSPHHPLDDVHDPILPECQDGLSQTIGKTPKELCRGDKAPSTSEGDPGLGKTCGRSLIVNLKERVLAPVTSSKTNMTPLKQRGTSCEGTGIKQPPPESEVRGVGRERQDKEQPEKPAALATQAALPPGNSDFPPKYYKGQKTPLQQQNDSEGQLG